MKDMEIEEYLKILVDKPLINIGRASNMLWLGFGVLIRTVDYKGNDILKSSISLHVQSTWRVINRGKKLIQFASSDIYTPNSNLEWSNDFDWDIQGINLFDEKSKKWFSNNQDVFVKEYRVNDGGDLQLLFSNEDVLEIFINVSDDSECWRLFEYNSSREHLVVTGQGGIFESEE